MRSLKLLLVAAVFCSAFVACEKQDLNEDELMLNNSDVTSAFHFNKQHWNGVDIKGSVSNTLLKEWIDHSYTIVVDSLPKSKRESL